jgi:hypothetical protein
MACVSITFTAEIVVFRRPDVIVRDFRGQVCGDLADAVP